MKKLFVLMVLAGLVNLACAATLFDADFEVASGYPSGNDQQIRNTTVSYGTWESVFNKGSSLIATYTDPAAAGPFGAQCARSWDATAAITFNTDSGVGNEVVRLEGFMEMTTNSVSGSYGEFGLADSTTNRQVGLRISSADGSTANLAYRSGSTTVDGDLSIDLGYWYKIRAELDYTTNTFKVWAAKVDVVEGSKIVPTLTDDDLVSFGGSTENSFSSGIEDYATRFFTYGTTGHNTFIDSITVESIPEPATLSLIVAGGMLYFRRRK